MKKYIFLVGFFLISCSLPKPYILPKYKINNNTDISALKNRWYEYYVYYSGSRYNPSAVCFILKDKLEKLTLHKRWKIIEHKRDFLDILERLEYLEPHLYVIYPHNELLGYLYTTDHTFLKNISKNKYFLMDVREQYNDIYYGGDGEFKFFRRP